MRSLKELYRIGTGPSSSHTMAPRAASLKFINNNPDAHKIRVTLFGSLAATGKGHLTDEAIHSAIPDKEIDIIWKADEELPLHTNGMRFEAFNEAGEVTETVEEYSVGGGALLSDPSEGEVYPEANMAEIIKVVEQEYGTIYEYVKDREGEEVDGFLAEIWEAMQQSVRNGLKNRGTLPGRLKLPRKAHSFYSKSGMLETSMRYKTRMSAYAYAVSEENASGGIIVTAPTCGACGVVPAVLYSMKRRMNLTDDIIIQALATAGVIGNIVKQNGSISGAYVGCQGEVGTACAMAAAAACQIMGGTPKQIGYAAEMGMEHHLGLTCDPVYGLVQIPCIERNAHAALRALDCAHFAILSDGTHRISFDDVVEVMLETGESMSKNFKETSAGGLARVYQLRVVNYEDDP
ncbi:MAG: L-serine ammonia-lyase [Candidatus Heimdallarchaeota archaeon]|nr:L-serine ammonia-lyase [Candidatus Heimdallarchaeota archaeon]